MKKIGEYRRNERKRLSKIGREKQRSKVALKIFDRYVTFPRSRRRSGDRDVSFQFHTDSRLARSITRVAAYLINFNGILAMKEKNRSKKNVEEKLTKW